MKKFKFWFWSSKQSCEFPIEISHLIAKHSITDESIQNPELYGADFASLPEPSTSCEHLVVRERCLHTPK